MQRTDSLNQPVASYHPIDRMLQWLNWQRFFSGHGPEPGPVVLSSKRVYILPTRMGLYYALLLFILLLSSINYNNSLSYALTFLLVSIGFVVMLHSYRNLLHLQITIGRPAPVFCGDCAQLPIQLEKTDHSPYDAISVQILHQSAVTANPAGDHPHRLQAPWLSSRRGRHAVPRLTLSSVFPVGLFRVWAYAEQTRELLVYPAPDPQHSLPREMLSQTNLMGSRGRGADDFAGLRHYQPGDSLRHIHWKAAARSETLYTKEFAGDRHAQLWLDWDLLPALDVEARLSRLTRWVLDASRARVHYGLRLPGQVIAPARGLEHQQHCLQALALYDHQPNPSGLS